MLLARAEVRPSRVPMDGNDVARRDNNAFEETLSPRTLD
jgi:hypothetical protein